MTSRTFGGLLIAVGILLASLSGLCVLINASGGGYSVVRRSPGEIWMRALDGNAAPLLIGLALAVSGWGIRRL